jgi:hypothetical protein
MAKKPLLAILTASPTSLSPAERQLQRKLKAAYYKTLDFVDPQDTPTRLEMQAAAAVQRASEAHIAIFDYFSDGGKRQLTEAQIREVRDLTAHMFHHRAIDKILNNLQTWRCTLKCQPQKPRKQPMVHRRR